MFHHCCCWLKRTPLFALFRISSEKDSLRYVSEWVTKRSSRNVRTSKKESTKKTTTTALWGSWRRTRAGIDIATWCSQPCWSSYTTPPPWDVDCGNERCSVDILLLSMIAIHRSCNSRSLPRKEEDHIINSSKELQSTTSTPRRFSPSVVRRDHRSSSFPGTSGKTSY